jgi:hypothetical protein
MAEWVRVWLRYMLVGAICAMVATLYLLLTACTADGPVGSRVVCTDYRVGSPVGSDCE